MNPVMISGGLVVDPSQGVNTHADVLLVDGKVAEVGNHLPIPEGAQVIDARECLVTPGWVDMRARFGEPGFGHRETLVTGTQAAAAGGFTSVVCLPNTQPVNDNSFVTSYLYQQIARDVDINVYVMGAVTRGTAGEKLAAIGSMWEAGVVAITDGDRSVRNAYLMRKALDYAKRFDLVLVSHAEDEDLRGQGVVNEGFYSMKYGLRGIPRTAEDMVVARDILLAELTGARLHFAHISTRGAVELIRHAKARGVAITAEASPHHLTLTDESVATYDTNTKVSPPLREKADVEALCGAVADGTVDVLASDHCPLAVEDKEVEYDAAEFGMVSLETAFPLYYAGVLKKKYSLERMVEAMTVRPAEILKLPKGTLARGADGDVTIADLNATTTVDRARFLSKSQNTPLQGRSVQGKVRYTLCHGQVVYRADEEGQ